MAAVRVAAGTKVGAIQGHHRRKGVQGTRDVWIGTGALFVPITQSQHRDRAVAHDLLRHAARHPVGDAWCPPTAHDDQVGMQGVGSFVVVSRPARMGD